MKHISSFKVNKKKRERKSSVCQHNLEMSLRLNMTDNLTLNPGPQIPGLRACLCNIINMPSVCTQFKECIISELV